MQSNIFQWKKCGKNIRSGICLFLGFREREGNYKYVHSEIDYIAGHEKQYIPMEKMWQEYQIRDLSVPGL